MYQATNIEVLFCLFFWIIALLIYFPSIKNTGKGLHAKYPSSNSDLFLLFSLITLYSVFEFAGGDFYHYKEFYEVIHFKGENDGLDPIYIWLADVLPESFYLWRFVIWGLAAFIWVMLIKRLKCSVRLAGCLFFLVVFFLFVGARQALGFSILYMGLTLIFTPHSKLEMLWGILLCLVSYFFHSTMIVYLILALFVLLPLSKKFIVISLLLFPVIYYAFGGIIELFMTQMNIYNEASSEVISRYLESDFRVTSNVYGVIRMVIDRAPIFILLYYGLKDVFWKKIEIDKVYQKFLLLAYMMIYISFLFQGREVSSFISPRFWDASLFPLTLFLYGYFTRVKVKKYLYLSLMLLIVSKLYTYMYVFYKL